MKKWLSFLGSVLTFAWFINFMIIFIIAFLSPTKSIHVWINTVGEANIEMIILLVSLPFALLALKDAFGKIKRS